MIQKKRLIALLGILSLLTFVQFILAAPSLYGDYSGYGNSGSFIKQGSSDLINFVVDWASPILQAVFGGGDYTGVLLFEKFLFFILIMSVVFVALKKTDIFKDQPAVVWVIAIILPLLAVRYLDFVWVNTILLEYQIFGIAVVSIIPLIVYFLFMNMFDNKTIRKIGWILFAVVYFFLWSTTSVPNYAQVYFWTLVIALILLFLDGTIQRAMIKSRMEDAKRLNIGKLIADLDHEIERMQKSNLPMKERDKLLKELYRQRQQLEKHFGRHSS